MTLAQAFLTSKWLCLEARGCSLRNNDELVIYLCSPPVAYDHMPTTETVFRHGVDIVYSLMCPSSQPSDLLRHTCRGPCSFRSRRYGYQTAPDGLLGNVDSFAISLCQSTAFYKFIWDSVSSCSCAKHSIRTGYGSPVAAEITNEQSFASAKPSQRNQPHTVYVAFLVTALQSDFAKRGLKG